MDKNDNDNMVDPEDILAPTLTEAKRILDEMAKTKDLAQRREQSEILRNLCQSAGVFFDLLADAVASNGFLDVNDLDIFDEDE
ncbi:MAG: hypothetical protein EOM20_15640 [Spartobacteria bacterium]|nr:hypothetical protein [Spartobacteria bacterium]